VPIHDGPTVVWWACPSCGNQVQTHETKCGRCGATLSPSNAQPLTPVPTVILPMPKSRGIYIILGLFLGLLGVHNFYAGHNSRGFVQLLITVCLGWLLVGLIITGVWVIIDLVTVTEDSRGVAFS